MKAAHTQRTEAAQARKEEKRRAEKDRIMNEDDPDKQRRLEVGMITQLLFYCRKLYTCALIILEEMHSSNARFLHTTAKFR